MTTAGSDNEWPEYAPWPVADQAIYCGQIGLIVRDVLPSTTADPVAMVADILTAVGSAAGRARYHSLDAIADQAPQLYTLIVGEPDIGAKGRAWGVASALMQIADPDWADNNIVKGLASGEALVMEVLRIKQSIVQGRSPDRRALIRAPEFIGPLDVMSRPGTTLGAYLLEAWDTNSLAVTRAASSARAAGAYISMVADITPTMVRKKLGTSFVGGGLASRILFICSRQSKNMGPVERRVSRLPPFVIKQHGERLRSAILTAHGNPRELELSKDAEGLLEHIEAASPKRASDTIGTILARAVPKRLRIAVAYAICDGADQIGAAHIEAAEALHAYHVASVEHLFSLSSGTIGQKLLDKLQAVGTLGMSRNEIYDAFGRHASKPELEDAITDLETRNLARSETARGSLGRPTKRVFAIPRAKSALIQSANTSLTARESNCEDTAEPKNEIRRGIT